MAHILVTGGGGYVGSTLVRRLLEIGDDVRVFDKFYFGREPLKGLEGKIEIIEGDIREFDSRILDNIEAVVHLAALSTDPQAEYNPKATLEINAKATEKLAKAAKEAGIRKFIFASSCSVYYTRGMGPIDEIKTEETPISPTSPYSKSKWIAEQKLLRLSDENFYPVILRKGTIFGFSPRMRYDLVVNTFVKDAYEKGRLQVFAGGEMFRPLVHIDDVTDAYIACLLAPKERVGGHIFNILHKNYWVLSLAHWVKHVLREKKQVVVDVQYQGEHKARSYSASENKIKRILGFVAEKGIAEGVNTLWETLSNRDYTDFDNPIYCNIKWMERMVAEGKIDKELR